jgi:hypothetical protein
MRAGSAADEQGMSSTVSPAAWLQAALARPVHAAAATSAGRHRAPEVPGEVELLTSEQIAARGRHADADRCRDEFDPARDEGDVLDWLGFRTAQD